MESAIISLDERRLGLMSLEGGETDRDGPPAPGTLAKELRRKAFHLLTLGYLAGYFVLGPDLALPATASLAAFITAVETARLRSARGRAVVEGLFGPLIRDKEARRYTGAFYTSLGALAVVACFANHPRVVTASLLYLAFGDAASAIIGLNYGRRVYRLWGRRRTLEGSAAGAVVALLCGWAAGLGPSGILLGGAVFAFADAVPLPPDDNFWIPVLPGTALWLAGF